jgi:hypothetical protein
MDSEIDALVDLGDPDELLREIDRIVHRNDWHQLLRLRNACRNASATGRQLHGVAGHGEYRLALQGPPDLAAAMVGADPGPLSLGPLTEVVAAGHSWDELDEYLEPGPHRAAVAQERVVLGEDLTDAIDAIDLVEQQGMPLRLQPWESDYTHARYEESSAEFPRPELGETAERKLDPGSVEFVDDPEVVESLRMLVETWHSQSNGNLSIVAVDGQPDSALAGLGLGPVVAQRIGASQATALMAWAGASGGAHGRRSGMARGRLHAWAVWAALSATSDLWPFDISAIASVTSEVECYTWDVETLNGFELRLLFHDPVEDISYGIHATDRI